MPCGFLLSLTPSSLRANPKAWRVFLFLRNRASLLYACARSDSREGSGTSGRADESGDNQRSDVMILLRVDLANRQVTMVSVPRDTPYRTSDGRLVKINEAYNIGGAAESIKAVSQLTGVDISHYAEVHFSELENIVDALGGVDVNVDIKLSYKDALTGAKITLQPGYQTLNGQQLSCLRVHAMNTEPTRTNIARKMFASLLWQLLIKR